MIKKVSGSKEFFLQKACGWALRQHAKVNPKAVEKFLAKNEVSNLTRREARKQLDKEQE
jgi:3-methyladenine DNA glycosylase AlkD